MSFSKSVLSLASLFDARADVSGYFPGELAPFASGVSLPANGGESAFSLARELGGCSFSLSRLP
jgi:hypothetical protein